MFCYVVIKVLVVFIEFGFGEDVVFVVNDWYFVFVLVILNKVMKSAG